MKRDYQLAILATVALFVLSTTWFLGPHINHLLVRGPNLVSEYESVGMPYAWLFRLCDALAAVVLLIIVYVRRRAISRRYHQRLTKTLAVIGVLSVIDAVVPITCKIDNLICKPEITPLAIVHGAESYLVGTLLVLVSIYLAYRDRRHAWLPVAMIITSITGLFLQNQVDGVLFGLQTASLIFGQYMLWYLCLDDIFARRHELHDKGLTRKIVAMLVAVVSIDGLLDSVLHLDRHLRIHGLAFPENTAVLSQHLTLVSLAMLYLARGIWQGSRNAWRLGLGLTFFEILREATFGHSYLLALVYVLLFVILLVTRYSFSIEHGLQRFGKRLSNMLVVLLVTTVGVTLISVTFRLIMTRQWNRSAFTPTRVIARVLLLEVRADADDPLQARLLAQLLTAVSIFMYGWLFLGLFLPAILPHPTELENDRRLMRGLLEKYSRSSEDYFKLWPPDKRYWLNHRQTAAVAYAPSGNYFIALADPITRLANLPGALNEFRQFARSHGAKASWLMVGADSAKYYKQQSYQLLKIGASAVVAIDRFAGQTVKNKWWRWKRNKAIKSGLYYEQLPPPHNHDVLDRLHVISNEWLATSGHVERGFALGYYDEATIRHQFIHVLKNDEGRIVAFVNQLPTERPLDTITIDMMRFLPGHEEAMAFLLSEMIIGLGQTTPYKYFDLGFVPLVQVDHGGAKTTVLAAIKSLLKPLFSSGGLEQFKNKFEPNWQANHIAFDGDYIDVVPIITAISGLLKKGQ